MKIISLLLFLFSFGISTLFCQVNNVESYLNMVEYSDYPEVEALYIKNDRKVFYGFDNQGIQVNYSYHRQIKIFDESGFDRATFEIVLRQGSNDEYLYDVEAVVYNTEGGQVTIDRLKKSNIYTEDYKHYKVKKFTLPNVQVGSVIDVKYKITSPFIYTIPRHFFQFDIPVESSELEIHLPNRMVYTPIAAGSHPFTTAQKDFAFTSPPTRRFKLLAEDVPPLMDDDFVLNINDYRTSIKYELHTFYFENGSKSSFSKSWGQIAKELNSHEDYGTQIRNKLKQLKPILEEAKDLSGIAQVQFVYDYVRENYSWNGNYGKYAEVGMKNLLKNKSGNVGDINILLVNLLKKLKIDALPVILKSRSSGVLNPEYPSITDPNYTMVMVNIDSTNIFLDATDKSIPMGQLPLRAINTIGVALGKKKAAVMEIQNPNIFKTQNLYEFTYDAQKKALVGTNKGRYSNFAATKFRLDENKDADSDQNLKRNIMDIYKIIDRDESNDIYSSAIVEEMAEITSNIKEVDDKLFIGALVENFTDKNVFTVQKRGAPVFLNYKMDIKNVVKLRIPEGYELHSLPEAKSFAISGKKGIFHYEAKNMKNYVMINYSVKISKTEFSAYEYPQLRVFMERIFEKQGEKIILQKI